MSKKRYAAEIDFFIYEDDEKEAIRQAEQIAKRLDHQHDNRCKVITVYERPHGLAQTKIVYPKQP